MKQILVVEDEQMLARIIDMKLREEQYDVKHAYDGAEAYQVLSDAEYKPDLVLLDLLLPKMSGFEVLEKLQAEQKPLPRVIIFSNFAQQADVEKAKQLGAIDYIVKAAFSPAEIMTRIQEILNQTTEGSAAGGAASPTPYNGFESLEDVKPMSEVLRPGESNNNP